MFAPPFLSDPRLSKPCIDLKVFGSRPIRVHRPPEPLELNEPQACSSQLAGQALIILFGCTYHVAACTRSTFFEGVAPVRLLRIGSIRGLPSVLKILRPHQGRVEEDTYVRHVLQLGLLKVPAKDPCLLG